MQPPSFTCPHCRAKIGADASLAGTVIHCPVCGSPVQVPGDPPPPAPPRSYQPPPSPPDDSAPTLPPSNVAVGWLLFALLTSAEFFTLMNSWSTAVLHRTSWFVIYWSKFFFLDNLNCDMLGVVVLTVASFVWVARDCRGRRSGLPAWLFAVAVFRPLGMLCYLISRPADDAP